MEDDDMANSGHQINIVSQYKRYTCIMMFKTFHVCNGINVREIHSQADDISQWLMALWNFQRTRVQFPALNMNAKSHL